MTWATLAFLLAGAAAHAQEKVELKSTGSHFYWNAPSQPQAPDERFPLMVWLHGSGDNAKNMIAVANQGGVQSWGAIAAIDSLGSGWGGADTPSIPETIAWMKKKLPIDENNIWILGFSAGGYFSLSYALSHQSTFKGMVICGAGGGAGGRVSLASDVLCGTKDSHLGQSRALARALEGARAPFFKYNEVDGMPHTIWPECFVDIYTWMRNAIDKTRPAPRVKKTAKIRFRVSVSGDATPEALEALSKRIQEASNMLHGMTGGLAWIEAATVQDQASSGDLLVGLPKEGPRVQLRKKEVLKVRPDATAIEIVFAVMHLKFGLKPLKKKDCLMDLKKLEQGEPVRTLCESSLQALRKRLPDLSGGVKPKEEPPKVEIEVVDR